MPHLLKSSCRFELLIARLADRKLNLSFRSIARSFDRGSVLGISESASRKQHLGEQTTHVITMVESIG